MKRASQLGDEIHIKLVGQLERNKKKKKRKDDNVCYLKMKLGYKGKLTITRRRPNYLRNREGADN